MGANKTHEEGLTPLLFDALQSEGWKEMRAGLYSFMGLFDYFRRKKEAAQPEDPKVVLPDGKLASPRLAALLPKLETLVLPCIRITATASNDLLLFDSKFGGYPYWPADKPYPLDRAGKAMYLLAQLNFSQMPPLAGYPSKGLLQFYLADDDLYGLNYDQPADQSNFRVVYFADTSAAALEDFAFLDRQDRENALPVSQPMGLKFTADKDFYSFSDVRLPEERMDELLADDVPAKGRPPLEDELVKLYPDEGHKIGGYAYFTQDDPRREKAYKDYVLLLQIDSQLPAICWGDLGVGNFFIHPDDLRRNDFSRVLYYWDCT